MPIEVDFGDELGVIEFPENMTEEQVKDEVRTNRQKYRSALISARQKQNEAETSEDVASGKDPLTFGEKVGTAAASAVQGAVGTGASVFDTWDAAAEAIDRRLPQSWQTPPKSQSSGDYIRSKAAEMAPTIPGTENSFWLSDVPQGVGNMGAMLATAAVPGALAGKTAAKAGALGLGFTAEHSDAYSAELQRQKAAGEPENKDKALAKATEYASIATFIEGKLGVGRLLDKAGKPLEKGVGKFVKETAKDVGSGILEESSQRAVQDVIVEGKLNPEGIRREGLAGGVVQGLFGIPFNALRRVGPTRTQDLTEQVLVEHATTSPLTAATVAAMEQELALAPTAEAGTLVRQDIQDQIATPPTPAPEPSVTESVTPVTPTPTLAAESATAAPETVASTTPTAPLGGEQNAKEIEADQETVPVRDQSGEVADPLTAPLEAPLPAAPASETVTVAGPQAEETITGQDEQKGSAMPVFLGAIPKPEAGTSDTSESDKTDKDATLRLLTEADNFSGKAANEAQSAVVEWATHVEDVVNPIKVQIRKLQADVGQMAYDAKRTTPETNGKQKLTKKAFLALYGVASKDEANALYKRKNAEWAELEKQLEAAEEKRKELESVKERRAKEWSSAATRAGELRRIAYPKVREGDIVERLQAAKKKRGDKSLSAIIPGLDPETARSVWNTALDIAIGLVKAGRALKVALDAAVAHIRSQTKEPLDEPALRTALEGAFPQPKAPSPQGPENSKRKETTAFSMFPDEAKLLYATQTEKGRKAFAQSWIDQHDGNLDEARVALMRADVTGINDALKSIILSEISIQALDKWKSAPNSVDKQRWLAIAKQADKQAQNVGSDQGQGLQAQQQRKRMAGASGPLMDYLAWIGIKQAPLAKRFQDIVSDQIRKVLVETADAAIAATVKLVSASDVVTSKVLRAAVRDAKMTFRQIFESATKSQRAIRQSIYMAVRQHPELRSLSPDDALELSNILADAFEQERFKIIRQEFAKKAALPTVLDADRAKVRKRLPELIRLANMGALDIEAFRNVLAEEYGLPSFSQSLADRIYTAAQSAQDKPEGSQRNEAIRDVYNLLKRESGITNAELLTSWWYASVLSGFGTQGRNIIGNAGVLADNFLAFSVRDPKTIPSLIGAVWRGMTFNIAGGEFAAIMKRGAPASRVGLDVREAGQAFEIGKDDPRAFVRFLSNGRFVSRFMLASDSFFYDANVEMRATWDAWKQGRNGDLTGAELRQFIFDKLNVDPSKPLEKHDGKTAAKVTAEEIAAGRTKPEDRRRRTIEILEQNRPSEIIENSSNFALEATLNNDPHGLLGFVAGSVIAARNKYPILTPIVPFVRISANVGNMLLQHSPLALARVVGHQTGGTYGELIGVPKNISLEDWQQLRAKVVLSHMALIGLWALAAAHSDDDDPAFQVTGSMEGIAPQKRRQLEEQGVRRYSIKAFGRYWDYRQGPWAIPLAFVGSWSDSKRYTPEKWNEQDEMVRFATALSGSKAVILDQNFLSSIGMLLDRGTQVSKDAGVSKIMAFAGRTVGGLVPSVTKEIDTWVNADAVKARHWWEFFQKEVPVARWSVGDGPVLNALGDPIQRPRYPWTFLSSGETDDRVWDALGEKANAGVFLPVPSTAATVMRNGTREKMDNSELYDYQRRVGEAYRDWFETGDNLNRFRQMTPEQAAKLFDTTFSNIRARERLKTR